VFAAVVVSAAVSTENSNTINYCKNPRFTHPPFPKLTDLKRVRYGDIQLNCPKGKWRYLSREEHKYATELIRKRDNRKNLDIL